MAYERGPRPNQSSESGIPSRSMGKWIPIGIGAFILLAAVIFFSSAGPDRTRTSEFNQPNSNRTSVENAQPSESGIPPSNQDTSPNTPPAPASPQTSNPAGTR